MTNIPETMIEDYCQMPAFLLPNCSENIFMAKADGGNHFLDFEIHEGMMLIFDQEKEFSDGFPSCFINPLQNELKVLRHREDGYEHKGRLVAAIKYYGENENECSESTEL